MPTDSLGKTIMHLRGRHQRDAAVAMFFVIPGEKILAEATRVLDRAKACRELWTVLQRSELGFRVRIVIADMRAAVGLGDTQVRQQLGDHFGFHA